MALTNTERQKRYYDRHPDRVKARYKCWSENNKELLRQIKHDSHLKYYPKNKEKIIKRVGKRQSECITFLRQRIHLGWNPRKGQCVRCKRIVGDEINKTDMHHALGYFHIFKWFGLEELCVHCHVDRRILDS